MKNSKFEIQFPHTCHITFHFVFKTNTQSNKFNLMPPYYLQYYKYTQNSTLMKRFDFVLIAERDFFTHLTLITRADPYYGRICPKITLQGHD